MRQTENVLQIGHHTAVFAVNQIQGGDEIRGAHTHKSLYNSHLRFTASAREHVRVQLIHYRSVVFVTLLEIFNDIFATDTEREHQESRSPAGTVLALCAMPQNTTVFRCLDD